MTEDSLAAAIRQRLTASLGECDIELTERTHQHRRHAAAREGGRHFDLRIVSATFRDLRPLARHRMVYDAVDDLMPMPLHALKIDALTPEQAQDAANSSFSQS